MQVEAGNHLNLHPREAGKKFRIQIATLACFCPVIYSDMVNKQQGSFSLGQNLHPE